MGIKKQGGDCSLPLVLLHQFDAVASEAQRTFESEDIFSHAVSIICDVEFIIDFFAKVHQFPDFSVHFVCH